MARVKRRAERFAHAPVVAAAEPLASALTALRASVESFRVEFFLD